MNSLNFIPFNPLFEIHSRIMERRTKQKLKLSILFLRFLYKQTTILCRGNAFNPLFEILIDRSTYKILLNVTFNPLFEIRSHDTPNGTALRPTSFNPLFEILARRHVAVRVRDVLFQSSFWDSPYEAVGRAAAGVGLSILFLRFQHQFYSELQRFGWRTFNPLFEILEFILLVVSLVLITFNPLFEIQSRVR